MDTVVGDAILRIIICADLFGAIASADKRLAVGGGFGEVFLALALGEAGTKDIHSLDAVLELGAFVLHSDDDTRGNMGDSDCGVGGVDGLAALAAGAVNVDFEVFWLDFEFGFFDFREGSNSGGGGMDSALGFGDRDALDAVDAAFEFELAVGFVARDADDNFFVSASIVHVRIHNFVFEVMAFSVAGVHTEEVASEEGGFVATGAGANFDDDWFGVVGIFGHKEVAELGLGGFKLGSEIGKHFSEIGVGFSAGKVVSKAVAVLGSGDKLAQLLHTTEFGLVIRRGVRVWRGDERFDI